MEILSQLPHSTSPCMHQILDHFHHLNFELSRSLTVKCDSVIGLPIYGFLVVSNSDNMYGLIQLLYEM